MLWPTPHLDILLDLALAEDLGQGDVTSELTIPAGTRGRGVLEARERLVLCGRPVVERLLARYGADAPTAFWAAADGDVVEAGRPVAHFEGGMREMLVLERTMLNFLQRMSGVATQARRYVDAVAGTRARIVDTRKTLPGWRVLDKYAVRTGGAFNHRAALDGGVLIKDNHLAVGGGITETVRRARANAPHVLRIEVEVETLEGLDAAIEAGAEVVLIDNFTPELAAEAVRRARGRVILEASGGIHLGNVRAFAEAGVDVISIGALTHSVPAADLALEVERAT
jgi:nicotinate-nucleotide pyrophosphorylase (carboxylating)